MEWYCQHCDKEAGRTCPYRDKELSEGAALVTNAGQAGAWYRDEEIDTRPTATYFWQDIKAYACNCTSESECPALREKEREIDAFIDSVMKQGLKFAHHVKSELYSYIMTKNNPCGAVFPRDIQLPREYASEVVHRLHAELTKRG